MSYFDHVRCHSCRSVLDPESLGSPDGGRGLVCPKCGVALALPDLFGLADAFADPDDEGPMSLDDLVPGAPRRPAAAEPRTERPAPTPARSATAGARAPASARSIAGPTVSKDAPDEGSSALAAMRALKRK